MPAQIIPLTASPNQSYSVQLQVDGSPLTLNHVIRWSEMAGYWVLSVSDSTGKPRVDSVPLITGWYPGANILAQHQYLKIGSAYILNTGNSKADYPGRDNLGTDFIMLWGDTNEVAS